MAVLALVAAVAGTAVASAPEASTAKLTQTKVKRIADREIKKKVPFSVADLETLRPSAGQEFTVELVRHSGFTVRGVCANVDPLIGMRAAIQIKGPTDSYYKAIATDHNGFGLSTTRG